MKPILIIRTGRAPDPIRARHGDFPHWFRLSAARRFATFVDVFNLLNANPEQNTAGRPARFFDRSTLSRRGLCASE